MIAAHAGQDWVNDPHFIAEALQAGDRTPTETGAFRHGENGNPVDASVLIPLVERSGSLHVIMIRRSAGLRHHPGQIGFPGGKIEPGDADSLAAALRETREEVGIEARDVRILGTRPRQATGTGFVITPHIGLVDPDARARPCDSEVTEVLEIPLAALACPDDYTAERIPEVRTVQARHAIYYRHHRIWGATGRILYSLAVHLTRHASRQ